MSRAEVMKFARGLLFCRGVLAHGDRLQSKSTMTPNGLICTLYIVGKGIVARGASWAHCYGNLRANTMPQAVNP